MARYLAEPKVMQQQSDTYCPAVRVYRNEFLIAQMVGDSCSHTYKQAMFDAIEMSNSEVSAYAYMEEINGFLSRGVYL